MNLVLKQKPDIIIVDDHVIFRQGLKAIINFEDIGTVIGEVSDGDEFIELLSTLKPDVVLMDIDMPRMNGFEATQKALELIPGLKIIVFTMYSDDEYYQKIKDIGAKGFIHKSSGFNELENAIRIVMSGENYFTNEQQKANQQDIGQNEKPKNQVNNKVLIPKKGKMLFFPWVVKCKNSINILNR